MSVIVTLNEFGTNESVVPAAWVSSIMWICLFHGFFKSNIIVTQNILTGQITCPSLYRLFVKPFKSKCGYYDFTWSHMYKILRWLNFKLAPNLDQIWVLTPKCLTFWISFRILSQPRVLDIAKVSHLEVLTRDQDFELILSEAVSKSRAYDLMGKIIPSITFWAISR